MKKYLVIGASSGIGEQLAQLLSVEDQVYGTYHSQSPKNGNERLKYHQLNVLDHEPNLEFLPESLDGLAYCPGTINLKPFSRIKPEDFVQDFELQVVGAVKIIQQVIPRLKRSSQGSIVLFSTVAVGNGYAYHTLVSTSKGGIEGLTRALAAEFAPGIRVNCIAPSLTDTPLASRLLNTEDKKKANADRHPLKRIGKPADIAQMAAFLLSDKSSWISGHILPVDGGISTLKV
ncbi:MAG: SDR family oxidoreductase [Saprospiraceae bacterium]|nr:SDR family oxidoreductase [Saprospiraceae bacterium]